MTLTFDPATHTYRVDWNPVPSVTQILTAMGCIDKTWYTSEACQRGTFVHKMLALNDAGTLDESTVCDGLRGYLAAWRKFLVEWPCKIIEVEHQKCMIDGTLAGTPDRVVVRRHVKAVIDIKTGDPEPWHELQTAGYAMLCGNAHMQRYAVYLSDSGSYRLVVHTTYGVIIWRSMLTAYRWLSANGRIANNGE